MRAVSLLLALILIPAAFALPHTQYPSFVHPEARLSLAGSALSVSDDIIHKTGYVSVGGADWTPVSLFGTPYQSSASWLSGTATLSLSSFSFPAGVESYALVFSCTRAINSWNCHATTNHPEGFWQLLVINNSGSPSMWSGELMTNGGFEQGNLNGWTTVGTGWASGIHPPSVDSGSGAVTPQAGSYAAYSTISSSTNSIYQDVDLTGYASSIDAGTALVNASGWGVSAEYTYDNTRIQILFLNAAKTVISAPLDTGYNMSRYWWKRGIYSHPLPANTRYVRVWANTYEADYDAGSIDSFSVRIKPSGGAACTPTTCNALGYNCGSWPDGCSGTLTCGSYGGGCQAGYYCSAGHCTACTPNATSNCYNGDVYWYNSCGQVGGVRYDCDSTQTCSDGQCVSTETCGEGTCGADEYCSAEAGVCLLQVSGNTYFAATWGDDDDPGTFEQPWGTWQKAFDMAQAGDIVYFRGGVWYPTESLIIAPRIVPGEYEGTIYGYSGTAENPISYHAYPGETPVIDGSNHIPENYPTMIFMFFAEHVVFKGITVRNLAQTPTSYMAIGIGGSCCSHFTFENMIVHDIGGRGYSWMACNGYSGITDDTTSWINCDTYNCYDPYSQDPGNGGDGWKVQNEEGAHTIFQGCRAWSCSDDGFDPSGSNIVIINNSWSFNNGFQGALDGNGFKSGGVTASVDYPTRIITNNIAANNTGYGYYDLEYPDYHRNNARVYNNLFYKNNIGIQISNNEGHPSSLSVYRNNIVHVVNAFDAIGRPYLLDVYCPYTESNNNWDYYQGSSTGLWDFATDVTVTDADFVSLDVSQLKRPRKADGSLPDSTFGHLAAGSDLIDAGVDVGLPYAGSAPDIGAFEYVD